MKKAKILVVDDDKDIRDSFQAILESRQYSVVTAANKAQGLEKAKTEKPDLFILDVMMDTWQDGFDMARELKQDPEFKDTPILMSTGVKEKTGIDFKSSAGDADWMPVDGFLEKPVQPKTLIAEVEKLLAE
jgi:two-component system alkaline phosphatase synthesis response regulator PhoP